MQVLPLGSGLAATVSAPTTLLFCGASPAGAKPIPFPRRAQWRAKRIHEAVTKAAKPLKKARLPASATVWRRLGAIGACGQTGSAPWLGPA
jgi:hypothetical protein